MLIRLLLVLSVMSFPAYADDRDEFLKKIPAFTDHVNKSLPQAMHNGIRLFRMELRGDQYFVIYQLDRKMANAIKNNRNVISVTTDNVKTQSCQLEEWALFIRYQVDVVHHYIDESHNDLRSIVVKHTDC